MSKLTTVIVIRIPVIGFSWICLFIFDKVKNLEGMNYQKKFQQFVILSFLKLYMINSKMVLKGFYPKTFTPSHLVLSQCPGRVQNRFQSVKDEKNGSLSKGLGQFQMNDIAKRILVIKLSIQLFESLKINLQC